MATLPPTTSSSQQPLNPEDEDDILDEYDQYSLAHPYIGICLSSEPHTSPLPVSLLPVAPPVGGGRKGRTKREAATNTNRPSPGGHERKLLTKFQNSERKKAWR
ncbi:Nuclear protein 1 [Cricetulus griseus]|uniref:Nuclear protein 1 n=1 Tax=Cricetulus griseus TaxID=10029 RepID=G3IK17_CRIGR|nr:Nuclear protein 1 [Cricetulus griseus]